MSGPDCGGQHVALSAQPLACGSFRLSADQIIRYARAYDPFAFHTDAEAARTSFFGSLCASGLQSASWAVHLAADACFKSDPCRLLRIREMRHVNPLFPDDEVVVHANVYEADDGLVTGQVVGVNATGLPIIELDVVFAFPDSTGATQTPAIEAVAASAPQPPQTGTIYLEHCLPGCRFVAPVRRLLQADIDFFVSQFPQTNMAYPRNGLPPLGVFALTQQLAHQAFWARTALAAGAGSRNLQWLASPRVGDEIRLVLEITASRLLKSRPGLGLVEPRIMLLNEDNKPCFSFEGVAFLRVQSAV